MTENPEQFAVQPAPERIPQPEISPLVESPVSGAATPATPTDTVQPAPSQAERKHKEQSQGWLAGVQSLVLTLCVAVFVITFIAQAFVIPSESMERTLLVGDYVLVDKTHFGPGGDWRWLLPYRKIKHGDIIVFRYPLDPKQHFVKRVIGLPGDRIRLSHKRVYVNGIPQNESYTIFHPGFVTFRDNFPNGDRTSEHIASRWYVQLPKLVEDGELIVPAHSYFAMGDNRDDSSDSRYWGFVPEENIVGRPMVIYWSMQMQPLDDPDALPRALGDKLSTLRATLSSAVHGIRTERILHVPY